jgi:beta-carotene hydroxylase
MGDNNLPLFEVLGRDLLVMHPRRRAMSLGMPFVCVIGFFVLAAYGRWNEAIGSTMLLTFLTYGSISHDLVHRSDCHVR